MPDRTLEYLIDGKYFGSKWLAWEDAISRGKDLQYAWDNTRAVINRDFKSFDDFDWMTEPSETFEELMVERAQQLRDSTPYLILRISGGSDSTLICNVFLKHRIKIDEILIYYDGWCRQYDYNWELKNWAEVFRKKHLDHIKLTTVTSDPTKDMIDKFATDKWFWENGGDIITCGNMVNVRNMSLREKPNSIQVYGASEPIIELCPDTNKYFVNMFDTDNHHNNSYRSNVIAFYTHPDMPKLHAKQCHLLKNYFREHNHHPHFKKHYAQYKASAIRATREAHNFHVFASSPFFDKRSTGHHLFSHIKTLVTYKDLHKYDKRLFDQCVSSASQKFQGMQLRRHPGGVRIGKYFIE